MANSTALTDDDFQPATPVNASNAANYALTDDDFSTTPSVAAPGNSNLSPNSLLLPAVDYNNQLGTLAALAAGVPKGIGELGAGANTLLNKAINKLSGRNIPAVPDPFQYSPQSALGQLEVQHPTASATGQFVGQVAPMLAINPTSMLGLAGANAAQNTLLNPQTPEKSAVTGFTSGLAGGALGKALGYIGNAVGSALQNPINAAASRLGVTLPLGDATQNATLKFLGQNVVAPVPGSGMNQAYQNIGQQLTNKLGETLDSIKGPTAPSDINSNIVQGLKDNYQDAQALKRTLYNDVNDKANAIGLTVRPDNYNAWAQNLLDENAKTLEATPELALPSDMQSLLQKAASSGPKSFNDSSLLMAKLNEISNQQFENGNKFLSGQISEGRDALKTDMEQGALNSGDPSVVDSWNKAQQNYAQNIAPYDDPAIAKYLKRGADPDLVVQNFVKTGQYARPTLLNKLMTKLPEDQQGQVGYSFLTKDLDLNPTQSGFTPDLGALNSYDNLPDPIKNQLFSPETKQSLDDISLIRKQVPNVMANPATGNRLVAPALYTLMGGLGASALHGNIPAMAGLAGSVGGANLARRALLSPGLRSLLTQTPTGAYQYGIPLASVGLSNALNAK